MAREALLTIAIGKKGVGKTYETLKEVARYLRENKRKVLILDVNNEYGNTKADHGNPNFPHIKALDVRHLVAWVKHPAIEARRISVLKPNGGKMSTDELGRTLDYILGNYQNGMLLIEDINKIVADNISNTIMGSIVTQRHMSVDIITHYQSIGKMAQPKLWANTNWVRMHKCDDTVQRHENKFGGNVEYLKIAEAIINNEWDAGNKHFSIYVDKDASILRGNFSPLQFDKGVERYLKENYKVVTTETKKRDIMTGQLLHQTQKEAVTHLMKSMRKEYYGNGGKT
jgi:hypothetical protein